MARSLRMKLWLCLSLCAVVALQSTDLHAQDLRDPTRPPNLSTRGEVEMAATPVLQSVLIGPNRKLAIIDGKTVKLNGKFGDQVLVKLTETEAVLKRGRELQTLKLFPDIEKKTIKNIQTK